MILKRGNRGDKVLELQLRLVELGHMSKSDQAGGPGIFGPKTEAAVRSWESSQYVQGIIDDDDWRELFPPAPRNGALDDIDSDLPTRDDLVRLYGTGESIAADWKAWWQKWGAPAEIGDEFRHLVKRGSIWVNRDIVADVVAIFRQIAEDGLADKLETFDGCFNPRMIRGSKSTWSTHTWAVALDFNAATNGLGVEPQIDHGIVRIFKSHGWVWGGDFRRKDGMHFQRVKAMTTDPTAA